jgi:pimeloyl-ACP methyl ester carboxylesterase
VAVHCSGDLEFAYLDEGDPGAPACLLLHGFPQDLTSWNELAGTLVARGYRVIRPDQRGYSPGARPSGVDAYRLGELAGDAVGLLDALGLARVHVVGHDWGGAVAWALGAAHPDRLISLTVLSTPHPAALSRALVSSDQALRSWYMGLIQVPGVAERALAPGGRLWTGLMRGLPEAARAHYTARARQPGALTAMLAWYRAMPRDMRRPSLRWAAIDVPTLYVWGGRDPALGAAAARSTSRYVRGEFTFVVLPEQGHWLPERAAGPVAEVLLPHLDRSGSASR